MSAGKYIIGIDEVGRGPLAGPMCVGAVMMPATLTWNDFPGLKDSKHLSPREREVWAARVEDDARLYYATAMVGAAIIDESGIAHAARLGVARSLKHLELVVGKRSLADIEVLLDAGLRAPHNFTHQKSIVRGDETEVPIALASIMAKVRRDAHMVRLAPRYPAYGFEAHKGYGTAAHRRAIGEFGLCELHRESFCTRLVS